MFPSSVRPLPAICYANFDTLCVPQFNLEYCSIQFAHSVIHIKELKHIEGSPGNGGHGAIVNG